MTITTTKPPRYGCSRHRNQQSCANKATIPGEALEREFLAALGLKLRAEDLREELVQALLQHLRDTKHKKVSEQEATDRTAGQMEATRDNLRTQIENLVRAIRGCGGSRAQLGEAEAALERVTRVKWRAGLLWIRWHPTGTQAKQREASVAFRAGSALRRAGASERSEAPAEADQSLQPHHDLVPRPCHHTRRRADSPRRSNAIRLARTSNLRESSSR
jgi:hypothetical protein